MDMNWLAFYIWLHLLLAALLLPVLIGLSRQSTQLAPSSMLRLWTFSAVLLLLLPLVLLQPWALDQQLIPWFAQGIQHIVPPAQSAILAQSTALAPVSASLSLPDVPAATVVQVQWPLLSQLLAKVAPPAWLWWLLPLVSVVKALQLYWRYHVTRRLRLQAKPITQGLPPCSLPVKSHPDIQSAMLLGWRHPVILLPQSYLQHLNTEQLALILQHEECHQQQGDLRHYLLQQLLGVWFWWSPAWHCLAAELNRWRELRCDALVSRTLPAPHTYANPYWTAHSYLSAEQHPRWLSVGGSQPCCRSG